MLIPSIFIGSLVFTVSTWGDRNYINSVGREINRESSNWMNTSMSN